MGAVATSRPKVPSRQPEPSRQPVASRRRRNAEPETHQNRWVSGPESNPGSADRPRRAVKRAETVAAAIVSDIVSRQLRPGDMLPPEAAMLASYQVSRASLREALRLLEVQEIIRLKPGPGGGPIVNAIDPRNLARTSALYLHLGGAKYSELFEAQLSLAPLCAEMAARNPDRDLVRASLAPYVALVQPLQGQSYWNAANGFHGAIEQLSGNRVIELLTRTVDHLWHEHVVSRMDTTSIREQILDEHRSIARAVVAGQTTKSSRLMREHFSSLHASYTRYWPTRFDELIEWE